MAGSHGIYPKVLPNARIVGCDIHPEAVGFLEDMGIAAALSPTVPEQLLPEQQFDVVFALSFFTHMPKRTWARWLRSLLKHVAPGGALIFTTHGEPGLRVMSQGFQQELAFDQDGFCFMPASEQKDLSTTEYGSTATTFAHVYRELTNANARLRCFQEGGAGYQDLYVVQRQHQDRRIVYAATIVTDRVIPVVVSIRHAWIEAMVTNTGSDAWVNGDNWMRFSFGGRLFSRADSGTEAAPQREFRAPLPSLLEPGASVPVTLILDLVGLPAGEYVLSLDVVKEQHFWFADRGGTCKWLGVQLGADSFTFSAAGRPLRTDERSAQCQS